MDIQQSTSRPDITGLKIDESSRNGRRGGRRLRAGLFTALAILSVAAAVIAFRGRTPVVEVTTVRPAGGPEGATLLNASGYVTPRRRATIAAKITARVLDVLIDEGMKIAEGQVLARLDDSDAQRRLLAARTARDATAALIANLEINLANAERESKRQQELEQAGYTTVQARELAQMTVDSFRAQIQAAREQVKAADAQIGVARQDVDNCTVRAPFAGIVVSKDAQVGEMVSLEIEVDVNESYIARVQPDQKVDAVLDAYPDWHVPSRVRTVIPTADRQKATVKVRISFDKLDPRILPDMGVKVAFLAEESAEAGKAAAPRALIPQAAVRDIDGKKVVFLVRENRLERRAVALGGNRGTDVEVMAGVNQGDTVLVKGPDSLREGQRVKIK
jgi:RND family efflux transporter MFP subunit